MRALLLVHDLAHLLEILKLPLGDGLRLLRLQQPPESAPVNMEGAAQRKNPLCLR